MIPRFMQEMMPLSSRCDMPRYASAYAYLYRQSIECTGACQFGRFFFFFHFSFFLKKSFIFLYTAIDVENIFSMTVLPEAPRAIQSLFFSFFFPFVLSFHR
jgi:hypothetical protein